MIEVEGLLNSGDYSGALVRVSSALDIDPNNTELRKLYARVVRAEERELKKQADARKVAQVQQFRKMLCVNT